MVKIKTIFIRSLVFALLAFIAGIFLGTALDNYRVDDLGNELLINEINTESYFAEQQFIEEFGGDKCELAKPRIDTLSEQLGEIGQTLTRYESKGLFQKSNYDYLRQKYFVLEIKMYTLLKVLKEECGYNDLTVVLFFYDPDQQKSLQQGYALDALVRQNENIHVFSIDRTFVDDPIIETVKTHFDVVVSPSIIVNFERKEEGYVPVAQLSEIV